MKFFIFVSMYIVFQYCECKEDKWLSKIENIKNIEDITKLQGVIIDGEKYSSGKYS